VETTPKLADYFKMRLRLNPYYLHEKDNPTEVAGVMDTCVEGWRR
jgi:hypothetical protein